MKPLLMIVPVVVVVSCGAANAAQTLAEAGALVCVTDKWDEKEIEKDHKIADAVMRCGVVPDDPSLDKYTQACTGRFEYMPDQSWRSSGSCTNTYKSGDQSYETWEEGSALKEYTYKKTGGTGKYAGASGGGTYLYQQLSDSIFGGRYKGTLVLP